MLQEKKCDKCGKRVTGGALFHGSQSVLPVTGKRPARARREKPRQHGGRRGFSSNNEFLFLAILEAM